MGSILKSRLQPSRPFTSIGVDYCGPAYIKARNLRKFKLFKSYIAVFVCFTTKAIHLELVSDAFLADFIRFISRRGIYSVKSIQIMEHTSFCLPRNDEKSSTFTTKSKT